MAGDGDSRGLVDFGAADLEGLLRAIEQHRLPHPLTEAALLAEGWGHLTAALQPFQALERAALAALLRAVLAERRHRPVPRVDLVWTGPEARGATARDTAVVVRELFSHARESVLLGGFAFDHGEDLLAPLHAAMTEYGVEALFFLNLDRGDDPTRAIDTFLVKNWPFGKPHPAIYYDPRTHSPDSLASLHAKCLVVDRRHALVTSANFTDRGHSRNIEAGVLIDDSAFATQLERQWRGLIQAGLVKRYRG